MIATCEKCGLQANVTISARYKHTVELALSSSVQCPAVRRLTNINRIISSEDLRCEHLDRAASLAVERFWGDRIR